MIPIFSFNVKYRPQLADQKETFDHTVPSLLCVCVCVCVGGGVGKTKEYSKYYNISANFFVLQVLIYSAQILWDSCFSGNFEKD